MTGWDAALRLALSQRISPEHFWRLSLREWRAVAETPKAPVLTRPTLDALIARFPDEEPRP